MANRGRDDGSVDRAGGEQRREPRMGLDQAVAIGELSEDGVRMRLGWVVDLSGRGAAVRMEDPMSPGTLVRMQWDDTLLLGEVCYCVAEGDRYRVGLELRHSLTHLAELERLRARLLGEGIEGGRDRDAEGDRRAPALSGQ
ncbi:MAG: PilZ domain-containing protein [Bryobacteraceae bacterium]